MKRDRRFDFKRRESKDLPPEKLYVILRGIYPKEIADEKYREFTKLEPPKEEE
jgi:hypothetical protein